MPTALSLLILEDEPNDVELEIAVLEEAGFSCRWKRVETREDFLVCLDRPDYDLIFSDYKLPAFDGLTAMNIVLEHSIDIPVIMVSGTLGEEAAIESLKAGATDYVLKNRLSRLPPVVRRALKEHAEYLQRKQAEKELRKSEERFRTYIETSRDLVWECDRQGRFTYLNPAWEDVTGYKLNEMLGKPFSDFTIKEDVERNAAEFGKHLEGGSVGGYPSTYISKSG